MPHSSWEELIQGLEPLAAQAAALLPEGDFDQTEQEIGILLLNTLFRGYAFGVYSDPDFPEMVPTLGLAMNVAAPVPDFLYKGTPLRAEGVYRLTGVRGSSRFVDIFTIRSTPAGTGPALNTYSLDDLSLSADGQFEVVLSRERPAGHAGDWWYLDPSATQLMTRCASYDWLNEVDPTFVIERIDGPARRSRRAPADVAERLKLLQAATTDYALRWLRHTKEQRARGNVNTLAVHDYSAIGGAAGQVYLEGMFDLADDEALLIETDVPERCRYWSVLVADELFATLDWMHRFSSINGHQAKLDSDGRFRVLISPQDPGTPNWLDVGGYRSGFMQNRWNGASSTPVPTCRKLKLAEVWDHMPKDSPRVTHEQRERDLRLRCAGAQRRRFW